MSKPNAEFFVASTRLVMNTSSQVWSTCETRELGAWAIGGGFPLRYQGRSDLPYLFCKVGDMNTQGNEVYLKSSANTIDRDTASKIGVKLHPPGTVVFPKIGGAIATNKRRILSKESAIDNNMLGIAPNASTDSRWLYCFLRSVDFSIYQSGTSVPALRQSTIGQIEAPRVPLDTQITIARFLMWLDGYPKAEPLVEAPSLPVELLQERQIILRSQKIVTRIENALSLRKESMNLSGQIWDAAASEFFRGSQAKRFYVPIVEADLALNREKRDPRKDDRDYFRYVDISSVREGPSLISEARSVPAREAPSRARRVIRADDIVFSTVRPNLRAVARVGKELDGEICSTGFAVFSCGKSIDPDFLLYQLCSSFFVDQCIAHTTGAHYPAINDANLKKLIIIVPPLHEQHRLVGQLSALRSFVDNVKEMQEDGCRDLSDLIPAVLDKMSVAQ